MKLNDPNFNKTGFLKSLETVIYLLFVLPLSAFGWVLLEKEKTKGLRVVFFEDTDFMFHGTMGLAIIYILMRTLSTWKKQVQSLLKNIPESDEKLRMVRKPVIYRNLLWNFGAGIGAYGLYEKGDMVYAIIFTVFLLLITTNRPTAKYFVKLLRLKGEERKWIES